MEALHTDNKQNIINSVELVCEADHSKKTDKQNFYTYAQQLKTHYTFLKDEFNNEQKIIGFALFHNLIHFLFWINEPISHVFGHVKKTLHLTKDLNDDNYHIVLTLFSELDDMDELSSLEDDFFEKLDSYPEIDYALQHIVIAQR